jgi:protein-L-isoaspartate(D-aspartate) O-methyltransferase
MDYARSRRTMVDNQVRPADVTDHRIIAALLDVPREHFVAPSKQAVAYLDIDVPVADDSARALLKPMVFGKLLQAAGIKETERVLDVGCATGYSAAVLARLAGKVVALEEDAALARAATANLGGASKVSVISGPLAAGSPQDGPYDVILLEGRSEVAPAPLCAQLANNGRLLAVIGSATIGKATIYTKAGSNVTAQPLFDAGAPVLPGFVKPPEFVF